MLTGSPSNVHPDHFGQPVRDPLPLDPARDATTLPLIKAALKRGIPLLAVCRGSQEINVALGAARAASGMAVHEVEGDGSTLRCSASLEVQYGPVHRIKIAPDGCMARILAGATEIMVNSVHGQGIDRLAPGLKVEALADDGLVEAYSVADAPGFSLAMQWHPEWRVTENPDSMKLFGAFGDACRQYQVHKR